MLNKSIIPRLISIILVLVFCIGILSACTEKDENGYIISDDEKHLSTAERFDLLMDELFADWVSGDAISLNYYIADPEKMGIERPDLPYGEVITQELIQESKQETQELASRLDSYNYNELRKDQQIVYDILRRNIELYMLLEKDDDFSYYSGYIRPLTGFQVQLPVLLAEFNFYTADDIDRYLDLLGDTLRYFNEVIEFERERSKRGFFLSDANVDSVIEQIESFLENREDNLLIAVFNDKIDNYDGLSSDKREELKIKNKDLVLNNVLAAYDVLLSAMTELRGIGAHEGGLASMPDGKEYARARLRLRVGTDKSPQELDSLYSEWIDDSFDLIMELLFSNQDLFNRYNSHELGEIAEGTPKMYIADLQRLIAENFPPIESTGLEVLEVHESLQEHLSPAFFLAPAIDRFNENVIYINPASMGDNLFLYTVLAHESYPGHMYQAVYYLQQSPHPVRLALSNSGYSEGWATYAEMISYYFALDLEDEASLMWEFRFFDMLIQGYVDLGVNVLGWTHDDIMRLLERFSANDIEVANNLFNMVTGVPLHSVMYSIGFIEMLELLQYAEELQGESFNLMEFHRFFLDFGSAPFSLIKRYMTEQIEKSPTSSLAPAA